jgi:tripartite-type tricarboxylate transporter receptor subunit TctC
LLGRQESKNGHDAERTDATYSLALAAFLATIAASSSHAQNYPNRPIRLIVPFAAGGAVDVLARLLGGKLADQLRQPVIVENRPGAGGTLAPMRSRNRRRTATPSCRTPTARRSRPRSTTACRSTRSTTLRR